MLTVRHLEREWNAGGFARLTRELLAARGEQIALSGMDLATPAIAAAITLVRLEELGQLHTPLATKLIQRLIATQSADGGWSDPATTALVLRALRTAGGHGLTIDHGINYLATLQKADGLWPAEPIRRLPADAATTAWIIFQLGQDASFRRAVRLDDALAALMLNEPELPADARRLHARTTRRLPRRFRSMAAEPQLAWS